MKRQRQRQNAMLLAMLIVGVGMCVGAPLLHASEAKLCLYQFRQKLYLRAAECFQALSAVKKKKLQGAKGTPEERAELGSLLRNASLAFRKAAKGTKKANEASYLRERALQLIDTLLKQKYYEEASQQRLAKQIKDKLVQQIGYINVIVMTHSPKSKVRVEGGYKSAPRKHTGAQWRLKLRPGNYMLLVQYPKQSVQSKQISLKAGQGNMLAKFSPGAAPPTPTPKPQGSQLVAWVLLGAGAAVAVTGAVLLGVSSATNQSAVDQNKTLQQNKAQNPALLNAQDTRKLRDTVNSANAQLTAGIVLSGVGVGVAAAGLVLYRMSSQKKKPAPAPAAKAKTTLLWRSF